MISAYRVWEEMTNDETFMNSSKYSSLSYLPPLSKHKKYKQTYGPSCPKSVGRNKSRGRQYGSSNMVHQTSVDPPLLISYASHDTKPLSLKETRLLMST